MDSKERNVLGPMITALADIHNMADLNLICLSYEQPGQDAAGTFDTAGRFVIHSEADAYNGVHIMLQMFRRRCDEAPEDFASFSMLIAELLAVMERNLNTQAQRETRQ